MKTPHKHAELIKAWADGARIEMECDDGGWISTQCPYWYREFNYRIKPGPKPNVVTWSFVYISGDLGPSRRTQIRPGSLDIQSLLRIEIDHNDPVNPVLVSAVLEKL